MDDALKSKISGRMAIFHLLGRFWPSPNSLFSILWGPVAAERVKSPLFGHFLPKVGFAYKLLILRLAQGILYLFAWPRPRPSLRDQFFHPSLLPMPSSPRAKLSLSHGDSHTFRDGHFSTWVKIDVFYTFTLSWSELARNRKFASGVGGAIHFSICACEKLVPIPLLQLHFCEKSIRILIYFEKIGIVEETTLRCQSWVPSTAWTPKSSF